VSLGEWFATFHRHYSGSKRAAPPGTQLHIPEEPSNIAQFTARYVFTEVRDYFTQDIRQTKCLLRRRGVPLPHHPHPLQHPALPPLLLRMKQLNFLTTSSQLLTRNSQTVWRKRLTKSQRKLVYKSWCRRQARLSHRHDVFPPSPVLDIHEISPVEIYTHCLHASFCLYVQRISVSYLTSITVLSNIILFITWRRMSWSGLVARMGQIEVHSGVLLVKPEVKRRLGRPRPRWKDNIKSGTPRK